LLEEIAEGLHLFFIHSWKRKIEKKIKS